MKKLDQKGFGAIEFILIIVIIGLLGAVGWLAYDRQKTKNDTQQPKTQLSEQENTSKSQLMNDENDGDTISGSDEDKSYLTIKEFNIRLPLSSKNLEGLRYSVASDSSFYGDNRKVVSLVTDEIEAIGCINNPSSKGIFKQEIYVFDNLDAAIRSQAAGPDGVKQISDSYFAFNGSTGDGACQFTVSDKYVLDEFRKASLSAFNNMQGT